MCLDVRDPSHTRRISGRAKKGAPGGPSMLGLGCLDVSRHRGREAFPGRPKEAHLGGRPLPPARTTFRAPRPPPARDVVVNDVVEAPTAPRPRLWLRPSSSLPSSSRPRLPLPSVPAAAAAGASPKLLR